MRRPAAQGESNPVTRDEEDIRDLFAGLFGARMCINDRWRIKTDGKPAGKAIAEEAYNLAEHFIAERRRRKGRHKHERSNSN